MRACHGGDTQGGLLELCPWASSMAFFNTKARGQLTVKTGLFFFLTHLTNMFGLSSVSELVTQIPGHRNLQLKKLV